MICILEKMIELLYGKFIEKIEKIILKNSHNINNFLGMSSVQASTVTITTTSTTKDTNARRPAIAATATATRKESTTNVTKTEAIAAPVKETMHRPATTQKKFKPPKARNGDGERPAAGAAFTAAANAAAEARKAKVAAEEPKRKPKERKPKERKPKERKPKEFTQEQKEAYAARQKSRSRNAEWKEEKRMIGFFWVRGKDAGKRATYKARILRGQIPDVKIHIASKEDAKLLTVAFPHGYISEEIAAGWASGQPLEFYERGWDATDGPVIRIQMHDASKPAKVAVPRLAAPKGGSPDAKQWDNRKDYPKAYKPDGKVLRVHGAKDKKLHNQPTGVKNYQFCASTPAKPCRQNAAFFEAVRVELAKGISPADLAKGWLDGTIKLPACCWRAHRTLQQCGVTEDVYEFFCEVFKLQKAAALAYEADLAAKEEAKAAEVAAKAAAKAAAKEPDEDGFVSATATGKTSKTTASAATADAPKAQHGGRFAAFESESEDETATATAAYEDEAWSETESEDEWPELEPSAPTGAWGRALP